MYQFMQMLVNPTCKICIKLSIMVIIKLWNILVLSLIQVIVMQAIKLNQNQKSFIQRMYMEYIDNMITHNHAK